MDTANSQVLPAPPSLMKALMAGFDAISNHIGLILFSVALDLLVWLGPHLRLTTLTDSIFNRITLLPEMGTPEMAEMVSLNRELWEALFDRFNLLSVLRTFPVGIPSLMAGRSPVIHPAGDPFSLEILSLVAVAGAWLVLTLFGLVVGTLYFAVVAQAAVSGRVSWRQAIKDWPWSFSQVFLLTLFWFSLLLGVSIPFSCLLSFFLVSGFGVGRFTLLLFGGLLAWLLLPLVFSPHGIFVNRRRVWNSVKDGMRLTRLTLPSTGLFFLIVLILSQGLDVLWKIPGEKSWLALIGIAGHAFVTTGLLAASFVYYRDADHWAQKIILQAKLSSSQRIRRI